ncbi:MAG TPA: YhjD/YihY/BrkB family envelope integrity protein, partial [Solirubrobacteraceae bacterium]|nr:YhjD/YihY/BrkB family envelope integrity protein [Solirubrobacteraceae bacterium]
TLVASLRLLALFVCFVAVSAGASAVREWSTGPGALVTLVALVPYAGLWLLVTMRLPHRNAPWRALVPGAVVFALGLEVVHAIVVYVISPWALAKQGTYGALGVASALLVGLFLISRLMVAAAVVNATLWERRPPGAVGHEAATAKPGGGRVPA